MQLPVSLLTSLSGATGFDRNAFEQVHLSGKQITSVRINPKKSLSSVADKPITDLDRIPWTSHGFYLDSRPSFTFDPLFHAGCYYVQEASSMFLEQALQQTVDLSKPLKVLDLCGAPGGKSTHIHSLISNDSLLVSNEVIRSRANILKDNIIKWGCEYVVVTNNDPKDFAVLENYFDVIVADAPCSGSGLFRRDPQAIQEWSENNVELCSQRQQRIIADVWPSLKKDGILIYSTCSYSMEEDENITDWILETFPTDYCPLLINTGTGITDTGKGYRFWPDKVRGEGFFISCFKKNGDEKEHQSLSKNKMEAVNKREFEILEKWVKEDGFEFVKNQNRVYAWPSKLAGEFYFLLKRIKVIYSGILVGELIREKMVPDHALALSNCVSENIGRIEVKTEDAIRYLQKKDFQADVAHKGWHLVVCNGYNLGWVNILPNRINNYYPKELRILKDF
jgi:16S rRNA C967 or C1407 C5-methylase (RsmB/RsmF family)/NOL1/NOP2/fmu family ribosome biogenesis protein